MKQRILIITISVASIIAGCQKAPPNLTPAGVAAFKGTQAIKALDLLRDTAIAANETEPPLVATSTTRSVVLFHKSAITIIHSTPNGWVPTVQAGLSELSRSLEDRERPHMVPYITLAQTIIAEVAK